MTTQIVANHQVERPGGLIDNPTVFRVLAAASLGHLLNDTMQALLPSIYPILKTSFHLNFGQIGVLTLTFQMTASIIAAVYRALHRPQTYALFPADRHGIYAGGLGVALGGTYVCDPAAGRFTDGNGVCGVFILNLRGLLGWLRAAGTGRRSPFSRLAGIAGQRLGPLLAAFVVLPHGQAGRGPGLRR